MVKTIIYSFTKQLIFWMLFFALGRTIFLFFNLSEINDSKILDVISTYWYALYLDISMTSYVMVIPFLILFARIIKDYNLLLRINLYYTLLVVFAFSLIISAELDIYKEWGTKLNYKALTYLKHPEEVFKTAKISSLIISTILIISQVIFARYLYKKILKPKKIVASKNYLFSVLFFLLTPILLFLGMRGGVQQIPIKQSDVYFSKNGFLNITAVNSGWNLYHSYLKNKKYMTENPYKYYKPEDAENTVNYLHKIEKDTTTSILNTNNPNIVFVILESWAADVVPVCGGDSGITPHFDKLVEQGLVFSNIYGTGARSDQGIVAIYSGYPAQPTTSIIEQPSKARKLPNIVDSLHTRGYYSSFHFGGQLNYGNIKAYLYDNNFNFLFEEKDFPYSVPKGRLGYHDEYLYDQFLSDIDNFKSPFIASAFTMSSHSPYDQPKKDVLDWGGKEKEYINSVYYADSCLGDFFIKARQKPWYNNTLFIIVADHSHSTPRRTSFISPEYKKIPMLFYGEVLKNEFKGYNYNKICSQVDIASTLLSQLKINPSAFKWSKNLFNPYTKEFAYYAFKDGVGWIIKGNEFAYHHQNEKYHFNRFAENANKDSIITQGKSYLQVLFEEYLEY